MAAHITAAVSPSFLFLSMILFVSCSTILSQNQPTSSISTDPSYYYNLCAPSTCNNLSITYPFSPPAPCHMSPLIASCSSNNHLLVTSQGAMTTFRVLSINYTNPIYISYFIASNALFTCGSHISKQNYKIQTQIFSLPGNYTIGSHFNCTSPIPSGLIKGLQSAPCLGCPGQDPSNICYYAPGIFFTAPMCETIEIYSLGETFNASGVGNLRVYLQSGFEIRYSRPLSCRGCEDTGGRCGQNPSTGSFLCFCLSSVHRMNCTDGMEENISVWSSNGARKKGSRRTISVVAVTSAVGSALVMGAVVSLLVVRIRRRRKHKSYSNTNNSETTRPPTSSSTHPIRHSDTLI